MNKLRSFLFGISRGDILLPMLKSFLLKEGREVLAGMRKSRDGVVRDAELTIACFKERARTYNHQSSGPDKTKDYYHPSAIGRCQRELWYSHFDAPSAKGDVTGEEMLKTFLIFEIGTYGHVMFQNLCDRAGVLKSREVAVVDHLLRIIGHCDGELSIAAQGDPLLEFKTINLNGFSRLTEPKEAHRDQITVYMALLKKKSALVVYFCKDTSELKEYRVNFDEALWNDKLKPRIAAHHRAIKLRKQPAREGDSPMRFPCSYCAYNRICYETLDQTKFLKSIKATS